MQIHDCPRFDSCSASICPLLPSISSQSMGNGERVCFYLTEYQKPNSRALFGVLGLEELYLDIAEAMEEIDASPHTDIYLLRAIKKAATSSSRMKMGIELKARKINGSR